MKTEAHIRNFQQQQKTKKDDLELGFKCSELVTSKTLIDTQHEQKQVPAEASSHLISAVHDYSS